MLLKNASRFEASRSRLFEKLYRAENVRAVETEGTGLGLYLVRLTMERLGGQVSYVSKEGQGSTFVVTLPIAAQRIMDSWRHEG